MSYTFEQYQADAARTINWELPLGEMLLHAVFGMSSEVGEVAGNFQKRYQGHELDKSHVLKEAGDALWFIAELCTACGVTMEDVAEQNIAKLRVRYPEKFDADRSVNREKYWVTDEQMEGADQKNLERGCPFDDCSVHNDPHYCVECVYRYDCGYHRGD